jgi:hypothetical protein
MAPVIAQGMMGSTFTGCNLYIMKGTPPTDFVTSFTSLSTRSSDILVNMGGVAAPTSVGQQGSGATATWLFLVGANSGSSTVFVSRSNQAGDIVRSSNVVTIINTINHGMIPGQSFTISGVTTDPTMNGTWTVATVPSASSFTFANTGANGNYGGISGGATISYSHNAYASGTATWFCLKSNALIPTAAFTSGNAVIGTIGVAGSGADMQIASTTITNGSSYTSAGFYLNIPVSWTF